MFSLATQTYKRFNLRPMVLWCSSNAPTNFPELSFQPKFSKTEQEKILNILNESTQERLLCFNIAQNKIKHLESYKKKKGPFKSIDELLEVDGLSVKILEKLCKQLITEKPNQTKIVNNELRKIKQMVNPSLPSDNIMDSVVGIHLTPTGVSWAKLTNDNNVDFWGYQDFSKLPKKLCPPDTFNLAVDVLGKIPAGDAYVFESVNSGIQKQSNVIYNLQLELTSMLLALINTSPTHNKNYEELWNCVYFLKSKIPARLFKTLVGNECVSNISTVFNLLDKTVNFTLPCSPIKVQQSLKSSYFEQSSTQKELLGQALLLTIAFQDLCIKKNPISVKAVLPGKKNNVIFDNK